MIVYLTRIARAPPAAAAAAAAAASGVQRDPRRASVRRALRLPTRTQPRSARTGANFGRRYERGPPRSGASSPGAPPNLRLIEPYPASRARNVPSRFAQNTITMHATHSAVST